MGQLFNPFIDVDFGYYEKIKSFIEDRIQVLNDKKELLNCIDEAIDILDRENMSSDDMSDIDIQNNKNSIETINLAELKNSDFYFFLFKENIQLHHLNVFMFIFQYITKDMDGGCKYMIELLNPGNKKKINTRKTITKPQRLNSKEYDEYWGYLCEGFETSSFNPERAIIKKVIDLIVKNIDEIIKNKLNLEFLLSIFRNLRCLKHIMDHIYKIRKTIFFNDVIIRPRFYDNYKYYKDALENNKKFREYVLYLVRKKNDWTHIRMFFFFDNQKFTIKLIR